LFGLIIIKKSNTQRTGDITMPIILAASVEYAGVLLALLIMLAAAKIMAEIFKRLRCETEDWSRIG